MADCHDNPILVFPQTVWFYDAENLRRCAAAYARHPDVTVCARDARSLAILQEYFVDTRTLLVPDMALCLEPPRRTYSVGTGRVLCMWQCTNVESGDAAYRDVIPEGVEVHDWPAYERRLTRARYYVAFAMNRIVHTVTHALDIVPPERFDATALLVRRPSSVHLAEAIRLLERYDVVISERLHGHILACLLGIPSILLDNSYGKNKAFHETWLTGLPNSYFAGSPEELEHTLRKIGV
jgi:pyruvyl transferase EpsO